MARVSLIEPEDHPALEPVVAKIRSGRRGTVINVYKLLLHTPHVAEVWLDLINAVRWKVDLDGRLREIVIIRVGYLNDCSYVVKQHVPLHSAPEDSRKRNAMPWPTGAAPPISASASVPPSPSRTPRLARSTFPKRCSRRCGPILTSDSLSN